MKKKLYEIFDEANPEELDLFSDELNAPQLSDDVLASVKNKVYFRTDLKKGRKNIKGIWLHFGAIAACFALIVSAAISVPILRDAGDDPSKNGVQSVSTITSGNKLTGKQMAVYGKYETEKSGFAIILGTGFYINTVVQAKVIEVLPDYYYLPDSNMPYHIARLSVVESIRGSGLPEEIFLQYPFYSADVFDGYETFIFSLRQIGVENYMMINDAKREIDYFSHMFTIACVTDLGYGSVIAFNNGKVDTSFFDKVQHHNVGDMIERMLNDPISHHYPVGHDTTLSEAKANIIELSADETDDNSFKCARQGDYITLEDVFFSEESKQMIPYLEPSETNVFTQDINIRDDRIVAIYTRVINGFMTDEKVIISGYNEDNGSVIREGGIYTEADLAAAPNIGEALEDMNLLDLKPPHTEVTDEMKLNYAEALGVYLKKDGKVYGIIRVFWRYTHPDAKNMRNACTMDDQYYLYDENGDGCIVEREAIEDFIGDAYFIWGNKFVFSFPYNTMIGTFY